MSDSNQLAEERIDKAEERTDMAEDRTIMANERTFAGWMRTGLAAVGIGIGFNALFGELQPEWLARAIASGFIVIGLFIFYAAQKRARGVLQRLHSHNAQPMGGVPMRLIAFAMIAASSALLVGLWVMKLTG